jgi:hypothetical protein
MASDADEVDGSEEGWYKDPYGIHEQRWVSKGRPTSLVGDQGVEGQDEVPDRPPSRPFLPATTDESSFGRDMVRADDPDKEPIPSAYDMQEAAYGATAALGGTAGSTPVLGGPGPDSILFETPFKHKMRVRARRERWKRRWNRLFGGKAK